MSYFIQDQAAREAIFLAVPPSGQQWSIAFGQERATVVEVGGGIREYVRAERAVLDAYPVSAMCDAGHGAVLIPWPNRLEDGRYRFDGREYQVPLNETQRRNAIHGLLRWLPWHCVLHRPDRVVVGTRLFPTPGYPFMLDVRIGYALGPDGLTVRMEARNVGDGPLPFGCGQHLYLSPGSAAAVDDAALTFGGGLRILTDPDRELPCGREAVSGTPYDFREGRRIGSLAIDSAFGDLLRDGEGRSRARLTGSDGRSVELWAGPEFPYVQVYTADGLGSGRRRRSLAVEPMTCPPNALRSGEEVIRLEPGDSWTGSWGVRLD